MKPIILMSVVLLTGNVLANDLARGFLSPPDEAKPRVFWWWINNLVDEEGITRDLEQFKAKGIGGVFLFNGRAGSKTEYAMPAGPDFMSPQWRELFKYALREADRLGIEVGMNLCSGWNAGGPWITPEAAQHKYVQTELVIAGPQRFAGKLPKSDDARDYHDVAVQAFALPAGRATDDGPKPTVTSSGSPSRFPPRNAIDGDEQTWCVIGNSPATPEKPLWLQLEYPQSLVVESLWIAPRSGLGPREVQIQVSEDGKVFKTIQQHAFKDKFSQDLVVLPRTQTRFIRILITVSFSIANVQISEVALERPRHRDRLRLQAIKAVRDAAGATLPLRQQVEAPLAPPAFDPAVAPVDPAAIVDLTDRLKPDGTLDWDVPAGQWVILRTGYANTGRPVKFTASGGDGLECEALDPIGMDLHFKSLAEVLINDAGPLAGKTLTSVGVDSWEGGLPNWSARFVADFMKYRGYDPRLYLPVLADYAVGSAEISDRFLYDYRKTLADCMADHHYGRLTELAHARGLKTHMESAGPSYPQLMAMDGLKNLGRCDVPMGEFWQGKWKERNQNFCGKQTATAAHIYGQRWVAAEAFTSMGSQWEEGPAELKPTADVAFCEGINLFAHHTATCTRPRDGKPGYEYFAGTHFNPNITWWNQAGAWTAYLARCQWMLSRGLFVADVLYYNGDNAPNMVEAKRIDPALGEGFDYDVCNAEVLLYRTSVKDGRIILPDGMSYRVLVLPERAAMPAEVATKIRQLVSAGAVVIGPRPQKDPGLKDYPRCDEQVRRIAGEVWGDCDGQNVKRHDWGKGRVYWGLTVREVLDELGVGPDFTYAGKEGPVERQKDRSRQRVTNPDEATWLDFIHRRDGETEIYFIANRLDREDAAACSFRVSGRQPELWDPLTGAMRDAAAFMQKDGRTIVPLQFAPHGSAFILFRRPIPAGRQGTAASNDLKYITAGEIKGPWVVRFDPAWGGPESVQFVQLQDWSRSEVDGIKYYSGTAAYVCEFDLPAGLSASGPLVLDLGDVKNLAEVKLNGKDLGVVWIRPFRVDVSGTVRSSGNHLEVRVTNLWPNRLIGDADLPKDKRLTHTQIQKFHKNSPLLPSGLLGPVTIQGVRP